MNEVKMKKKKGWGVSRFYVINIVWRKTVEG